MGGNAFIEGTAEGEEAAGWAHLRDALAVATEMGSPRTLFLMAVAYRLGPVGPFECGFFKSLSDAAIFGHVPEAIPPALVPAVLLIEADSSSIGDIEYGLSISRLHVQEARASKDSNIVLDRIKFASESRSEDVGFLLGICGTAYNCRRH